MASFSMYSKLLPNLSNRHDLTKDFVANPIISAPNMKNKYLFYGGALSAEGIVKGNET